MMGRSGVKVFPFEDFPWGRERDKNVRGTCKYAEHNIKGGSSTGTEPLSVTAKRGRGRKKGSKENGGVGKRGGISKGERWLKTCIMRGGALKGGKQRKKSSQSPHAGVGRKRGPPTKKWGQATYSATKNGKSVGL